MSEHVLIAGAGVAGLETLLALQHLAGDRVHITLLAPEIAFVNNSMCAAQPFQAKRVRGIKLGRLAGELGARWRQDALDRVQPGQRRVITKSGERIAYDQLVLATGCGREQNFSDALSYRNGRDGPNYRLLLERLRRGRVNRIAFVKPPGPSLLLPLYDLALMTAADCAAHDAEVELSFITPEEEPLVAFGPRVTAAVRQLLAENDIALHTSSYAVMGPDGGLRLRPGARQVATDQMVVTEPRLFGRRVPGIPFDCDTFIPIDDHGRVRGMDHVYAAGDTTNFPLKQGGLAAQQADAVAEAIAASAGADLEPQPFRPILRSVLLTGATPRYLHADISGRSGDDSLISTEPLWWPPRKLAARYLAPYLSSRTGPDLDVHLPQAEAPLTVGTDVDTGPCELADLPVARTNFEPIALGAR